MARTTVRSYTSFVFEVIAISFHVTCAILNRIFIKPCRSNKRRSLKDEIVLVTGGSSGIGKAILLHFAKLDPQITLISWDIDQHGNKQTVKQLKSLGVSKAFNFEVDITDPDQVEATATKVRQEIGDVTMLFNNAGVGEVYDRPWEIEMRTVRKVIEVNLISHFSTLKAFLPAMIRENKGHVVATCSVFGFLFFERQSPYCASKAAVRATMECLKQDLLKDNPDNKVQVSLVYPALVHTNMTASLDLRPKKYPFLAPGMEPSYTAQKVVEGVLANDEHIYVPCGFQFLRTLLSMLPWEVMPRILGLYDASVPGPPDGA